MPLIYRTANMYMTTANLMDMSMVPYTAHTTHPQSTPIATLIYSCPSTRDQ